MSEREFAFIAKGSTYLIPSATTAPSGVQVSASDPAGRVNADCYQVYNAGSETSFLAWGSSAAIATANAVIPTAGNPKKCIPIPAGAVIVIRASNDAYFSGINSSTAGSVFITPGEGV